MQLRTITIVFALLIFCSSVAAKSVALPQYSVPRFGFASVLPENWSLRWEIEDSARAVVSFGMPMVYSEVEKQEIENAVSIRAIKSPQIKSVVDVKNAELARTAKIVVSSEDIDLDFGKGVRTVSEIRGLRYESVQLFRFEHGIGYTVSFTATKGTFEYNFPKFVEYLKTVSFFAPDAKRPKVYPSRMDEAMMKLNLQPPDWQRVVELMEVEIKENPANENAFRILAMSLFEVGSFDRALVMLDSAVSFRSTNISAPLELLRGRILHGLGRSDEALQKLTALSAFFQNEPGLTEAYNEFMGVLRAAKLDSADVKVTQ